MKGGTVVARKLSDKIIPVRMYIVGNTPYIDSTMARERIEVTRKLKLDNNEMSGNKFALIQFIFRRITASGIYFQKNYWYY